MSATLANTPHVAFVPITDKEQALAFYRDQLGLALVADQSPFALVFDLNGTQLRATFTPDFKPQPFTILGWRVAHIEAVAAALQQAGVRFNRYPASTISIRWLSGRLRAHACRLARRPLRQRSQPPTGAIVPQM